MRDKKNVEKKILLITFSNNADHQDIAFGMYEALKNEKNIYLACIKRPKLKIEICDEIKLVNCPEKPGICKKTFDLFTLFKFIGWIKKEKFDIVFFESLHIWNIPIMILCRKQLTYQMIFDVIPHEGERHTGSVKKMNAILGKIANKIVLVNQKYINTMSELYHVPQKKIEYIRMWRRFPDYQQPQFTKSVLFFGRINPYKGITNLVEIIEKCPDILFKIYGPVDKSVTGIVEKIEDFRNVDLQDRYFIGSEMDQVFVDADWILLPYNSATISGVVVDAYRNSRPVIAFNVGAIQEQVKDGQTGYLIQAGDNDAFSEKIKSVFEMESDQYTKMCKNAYDYGMGEFSVESIKDDFVKMIELS